MICDASIYAFFFVWGNNRGLSMSHFDWIHEQFLIRIYDVLRPSIENNNKKIMIIYKWRVVLRKSVINIFTLISLTTFWWLEKKIKIEEKPWESSSRVVYITFNWIKMLLPIFLSGLFMFFQHQRIAPQSAVGIRREPLKI